MQKDNVGTPCPMKSCHDWESCKREQNDMTHKQTGALKRMPAWLNIVQLVTSYPTTTLSILVLGNETGSLPVQMQNLTAGITGKSSNVWRKGIGKETT